jgi:hypothetical protein
MTATNPADTYGSIGYFIRKNGNLLFMESPIFIDVDVCVSVFEIAQANGQGPPGDTEWICSRLL